MSNEEELIVEFSKKQARKQMRARFYEELKDRFPSAFPATKEIRPLAVGIREALIDCGYQEDQVGAFLRWYCYRVPYHQAILKETCRVDLEGNPAGEVDEACRTRAQEVLAQIKMFREAKKESRKRQKKVEQEAKARKAEAAMKATPMKSKPELKNQATLNGRSILVLKKNCSREIR